jgi:hypothetical protein
MDDERAIQQRLMTAVEKMQDSLSRSHLRPLMRAVHQCSLTCYDSPSSSDRQIQECEEQCARFIKVAHHIVESEIKTFESRLQRGFMDCQDAANDRVTEAVRADPKKVQAVQADMLKCVSAVADKHIALLPGIQKKIESEIKAQTK